MQYFTSDVKRKKRSQNVSQQTNPTDENFQQTVTTKLIALLQKNFCLHVLVNTMTSAKKLKRVVQKFCVSKQYYSRKTATKP